MKITYTQNPLKTIVELDEHEKRELWHRIRFEQMLDMLFSVHFELTCRGDTPPDLERIKKEVDPDYYLNDAEGTPDKTRLDARCDALLEHYLEELQGSHAGDCTCFAMSCSKCHAESVLGIDTIKGLGKHPGHKIMSAFSRGRDPADDTRWLPDRTLDEAIEQLRNYDPKPTSVWSSVEAFYSNVPRWKAEAKSALEWLEAYRDQHFPKETA